MKLCSEILEKLADKTLVTAESCTGGMLSAQTGCAYGQRVRNGQPLGACRGLGISPVRAMRLLARAVFGSGTGTALIRALE